MYGDKRPTEKIKFSELVRDYLKNCSIHGLQYLLHDRWTVVFWMISIVSSITGCSFFISSVYKKWEESPVIVSFAVESSSVTTIPFPAITICPQSGFRGNFSYLLTDNVCHFTDDETNHKQKLMIKTLHQFCNIKYDKNLNFKTCVSKQLRKMWIPFDDLFKSCIWRDEQIPCSKLFTEIWTDDGICYTFNMKEGNLHQSIKSKLISNEPKRILGAGVTAGLELILNGTNAGAKKVCSKSSAGFMLDMHSSIDIPTVSHRVLKIPLDQELTVAVRPNVMTTSDMLIDYPSDVRQCYFDGEKNLKFFKFYTQLNCEMESLTNFTLRMCGCIRIGMPFDDNTDICGFNKQTCAVEAEEMWIVQNWKRNVDKIAKKNENCLPSCSSITYQEEISKNYFYFNRHLEALGKDYNENDCLASVKIYFKETRFFAVERSELFGWQNFFSYCGGLLGVFTGFSILSLVELIYHFTLRVLCTWCIALKKEMSMQINGFRVFEYTD